MLFAQLDNLCIALFKLNPQNVVFWLAAPILLARQNCEHRVHERIDGMWKIHENRLRRGLGGSY